MTVPFRMASWDYRQLDFTASFYFNANYSSFLKCILFTLLSIWLFEKKKKKPVFLPKKARNIMKSDFSFFKHTHTHFYRHGPLLRGNKLGHGEWRGLRRLPSLRLAGSSSASGSRLSTKWPPHRIRPPHDPEPQNHAYWEPLWNLQWYHLWKGTPGPGLVLHGHVWANKLWERNCYLLFSGKYYNYTKYYSNQPLSIGFKYKRMHVIH